MMDHQLAEAAFWSFLTNIRDGVVLLEENGSVIHVNPQAQELLQLYHPLSHLVEIFQAVDPRGVWERWNELLSPPHALFVDTSLGDVYIEAKPLVWGGKRIVQLIVTGSVNNDRPLEDQTREELMSQIGQLRERSSQLAHHARQAELLNILAEASAVIANTIHARSILAHLGEFMIRLVNGAGVTLYRWTDDGQSAEMMVDFTRQVDLEPSYDLGVYPLANYSVMSQMRDEQSILICEGVAYIPGPPSWARSDLKHNVMLLPILSGGEPFGVVALATNSRDPDPTEEEFQILFTLLNQASGALERVRLFENIRERERFLSALNRVGVAINGTLDLARVLNLICRESMNIFGLDGVYIWHKPESENRSNRLLIGLASEGHASKSFLGSEINRNETRMLAYQVAKSGSSRFINHFSDQPDVDLKLPDSDSVQAVLGAPLLYEEKPLGVLIMVDRHRPNRFSQRDIERVQAFAVQAATALRNAQMVTRLKDLNEDLDRRVADRTRDLGQERDRVRWLLRINNELTSTLDEDRVLVRGLELVNEVVQASQGLILLYDEATNGFVIRAELVREGNRTPPDDETLRDLDALANRIVDYRQGIIIQNLGEDPQWSNFVQRSAFSSAMGVPLIFSGEMIGVMMLFDQLSEAFSEQQLRLVEAAGSHVANAIYNAHLFVLIRNQAERLGNMLRTEQVNAAKTQSMLESIADGVLVVDENGAVIVVNDAFGNMFGVERNRILGRPVTGFSGLLGPPGQEWLTAIQEWQTITDEIHGLESLEATIELDDRHMIVRYHLAPVFVGGQFFGTVTIFRDITQEVQIDRMKTEFVSTVSHELRTPLTVVKGYLDLLLMGAIGPLDENVSHYLNIVKNNTNRLQELVSDLLDISRIEAGRMVLEFQPLDIITVIEAVVNSHLRGRIEHENKPIETIVDIRGDLPLVEADPVRLQQVLTNLVDNAFNYTPQNGRIVVEAFNENAAVCVRVIDNGIGIDPAEQEKIFQRFFRSDEDPVQEVAGTGLGLTIVKSLIEMHGGTIEVISEPGTGSEFRFTLPFSQSRRDPEDGVD